LKTGISTHLILGGHKNHRVTRTIYFTFDFTIRYADIYTDEKRFIRAMKEIIKPTYQEKPKLAECSK